MSQSNKIKIGFLINLFGWVIGFCIAFDKQCIVSVGNKKYFIIEDSLYLEDYIETFTAIFLNNLTVAVIILLMGYLTFGLISICISILNGVLLAIHMTSFLTVYDSSILYKAITHLPTELYAFCYLGAIGLLGFGNIYNINKNETYNFFFHLPPFKCYIIPFVLLILSALIESDCITLLLKQINIWIIVY